MATNEDWVAARVAARSPAGEDIWCLELEGMAEPLPDFEPGAHVDVRIGDLIRQYSLCHAPAGNGRYTLGVQREQGGRGGSRALCDSFQVGDILQLRGPRNLFRLSPDTRSAVLLAGGIGVTPLLSMAEHLRAQGTPFELHVYARTAVRLPLADRLSNPSLADSVHVHLDDAVADASVPLSDAVGAPAPGRHLYLCGPGGFVEAALAAASAAGWRREQIHCECFSSNPIASGDDQPFVIEIRSTGQLINVPAGTSAGDALEKAGAEVVRSCNEGNCGTCITRVLAGTPLHRDHVLTDEEHTQGCFTPCCSRALSDVLVLDL